MPPRLIIDADCKPGRKQLRYHHSEESSSVTIRVLARFQVSEQSSQMV